MASHHYRHSWSYEDGDVEEKGKLAEKLRQAVGVAGADGQQLEPALAQVAFRAAMDDDLDTPAALDIMLQLADEIILSAGEGGSIQAAQGALREMSQVLGLRLDQEHPEERVIDGWRKHRSRFEELG
jgi:cysteinyl-tRNA synthetase